MTWWFDYLMIWTCRPAGQLGTSLWRQPRDKHKSSAEVTKHSVGGTQEKTEGPQKAQRDIQKAPKRRHIIMSSLIIESCRRINIPWYHSCHHIFMSSYRHEIISSHYDTIMSSCHHITRSSDNQTIMSSCVQHHIIMWSFHHVVVSGHQEPHHVIMWVSLHVVTSSVRHIIMSSHHYAIMS